MKDYIIFYKVYTFFDRFDNLRHLNNKHNSSSSFRKGFSCIFEDKIIETDKLINSMAGKVQRKTTDSATIMTKNANIVWDNIAKIGKHDLKSAGRLYNKMMTKVKIPYTSK